MKELSVEEKAKRYDEAFKRAKDLYDFYSGNPAQAQKFIDIFPELAESEDERIREWLIEFVEELRKVNPTKEHNGMCSRAIAWLEKQGEQKPADKVEPKFKVGDKIRRKIPSSCDKDMQVARIEKDYYICNHIGKFSSEVIPFSKESSYELVEQKPAWSEEDERIKQDIENLIHFALKDGSAVSPAADTTKEDAISWLKSLKERYTWKPSEEQMEALDDFIYAICPNIKKYRAAVKSLYQDLKKLR